jgi:hypothetical protein
MSDAELEDEILGHVGMDRRSFVKRLILGGAFAVPVVASFDMGALAGVASARQPNGTRSGEQHLAHRFPNGTSHHGDDSHVEY